MLNTLFRLFLKPFRPWKQRCPCGLYWVTPISHRKDTSGSTFPKWKEDPKINGELL